MTTVNINTLYRHVSAVYDHPSRSGVKPGCDCGCGGDSIDWDMADFDAELAKQFFAGIGIDVSDDVPDDPELTAVVLDLEARVAELRYILDHETGKLPS